jgi:hypothetical protein
MGTDADPALSYFHPVNVGSVSNVSEVFAASILKVKVRSVGKYSSIYI